MVKQVGSNKTYSKLFQNIVDIIMFQITNIFGRISTSILNKQQNKVANWPITSICRGCVHFKLMFQSQNINYFTANQQ